MDGVLALDKARDIAIIKANGNDFRMLSLGDSSRLQIGEEVVAIGSPLSLESTVSNGIVSGIRTLDEGGGQLLQITAPISPGSSGGPLFNMEGQVVGITTSGFENGENLNFAVPINNVKPLLKRLSKPQAFPREECIVGNPCIAVLKNGFSIRHVRSTVFGQITRFYIGGDASGFVDVPTGEIDHFEPDLGRH